MLDPFKKPLVEIIDTIQTMWNFDYGAIKIDKQKEDGYLHIEIHTGGWSDNESVISALEQSSWWNIFWQKSHRGGHYWLRAKDMYDDKPKEQAPMEKIEIELEYAKNILKVLENHESLCFAIVSKELKDIASKKAYKKLQELFDTYHNANCGPFNRALKRIIENKK